MNGNTDDQEPTPSETPTESKSKVARLLSEYELEGLGDELAARWTDDGDARDSLRDLADDFNRELLHTSLAEGDSGFLDGEVANIYRLLVDDEVTRGDNIDARRRLERAGVDVDNLEADFVSRQAIHTYLTEVRGLSHSSSSGDPVTTATSHLQQFKHRLTAVAESKLARLQRNGHLTLGSFRVIVDVQILCEDCHHQYPVSELLAAGSCACDTSGPT